MKKFFLSLSTGLLFMGIPRAQACSICFFGDPTQKINVALRWAIVTLLIILLFVMVFFVKFFMSVARRSKPHLTQNA